MTMQNSTSSSSVSQGMTIGVIAPEDALFGPDPLPVIMGATSNQSINSRPSYMYVPSSQEMSRFYIFRMGEFSDLYVVCHTNTRIDGTMNH